MLAMRRVFIGDVLYRGVECELVIYPREGHGAFPPFERMHYIDSLKRIERFYGENLKGTLSSLRFQTSCESAYEEISDVLV
jgi:hypothetical protein